MELINLFQAFNLINEKVFNGTLPSNTVVAWNPKLKRSWGRCFIYKNRIELQPSDRFDSLDYVCTLVHECCHLWLNNKGAKHAAHGKEFQALAKYCNNFGFDVFTWANKEGQINRCGGFSFDGSHLYLNGRIYR